MSKWVGWEQAIEQGVREAYAISMLAYASERVGLKCQFSDHVKILFAAYCALDLDIPVNMDKVMKTNWLGESRVINYY